MRADSFPSLASSTDAGVMMLEFQTGGSGVWGALVPHSVLVYIYTYGMELIHPYFCRSAPVEQKEGEEPAEHADVVGTLVPRKRQMWPRPPVAPPLILFCIDLLELFIHHIGILRHTILLIIEFVLQCQEVQSRGSHRS